MFAKQNPADHGDRVNCIAFDFYGKRMATGGSDDTIKVWDLSSSGWSTSEEKHINVHKAPIWNISWAHPEFGQALASCSSDRTVVIHEEKTQVSKEKGVELKWCAVQTLDDSRVPVRDVKFAPKHHGLVLASCAEDGKVRIYEAPDAMALGNWTLQEEFKLKGKDPMCTSLSWSQSKSNRIMLAVGCRTMDNVMSSEVGKIQVWETQESRRLGLAEGVNLQVQEDVVNVAFAPNLGRSFQLLAGACSKKVRIWKIASSGMEGGSKYDTRLELEHEHVDEIWRLAWNVTGTALAATANDGRILIFQVNFEGKWEPVNKLEQEES
eukprot:m.17919 g.17919  ORF g.17919 m.17919 type:complete len:323 (-) comp6142_c0_seq1:161-1129(-)